MEGGRDGKRESQRRGMHGGNEVREGESVEGRGGRVMTGYIECSGKGSAREEERERGGRRG